MPTAAQRCAAHLHVRCGPSPRRQRPPGPGCRATQWPAARRVAELSPSIAMEAPSERARISRARVAALASGVAGWLAPSSMGIGHSAGGHSNLRISNQIFFSLFSIFCRFGTKNISKKNFMKNIFQRKKEKFETEKFQNNSKNFCIQI